MRPSSSSHPDRGIQPYTLCTRSPISSYIYEYGTFSQAKGRAPYVDSCSTFREMMNFSEYLSNYSNAEHVYIREQCRLPSARWSGVKLFSLFFSFFFSSSSLSFSVFSLLQIFVIKYERRTWATSSGRGRCDIRLIKGSKLMCVPGCLCAMNRILRETNRTFCVPNESV